jgi:hypothetical protein
MFANNSTRQVDPGGERAQQSGYSVLLVNSGVDSWQVDFRSGVVSRRKYLLNSPSHHSFPADSWIIFDTSRSIPIRPHKPR